MLLRQRVLSGALGTRARIHSPFCLITRSLESSAAIQPIEVGSGAAGITPWRTRAYLVEISASPHGNFGVTPRGYFAENKGLHRSIFGVQTPSFLAVCTSFSKTNLRQIFAARGQNREKAAPLLRSSLHSQIRSSQFRAFELPAGA